MFNVHTTMACTLWRNLFNNTCQASVCAAIHSPCCGQKQLRPNSSRKFHVPSHKTVHWSLVHSFSFDTQTQTFPSQTAFSLSPFFSLQFSSLTWIFSCFSSSSILRVLFASTKESQFFLLVLVVERMDDEGRVERGWWGGDALGVESGWWGGDEADGWMDWCGGDVATVKRDLGELMMQMDGCFDE